MSREDVFIANILKSGRPATATRSRRRSRPAGRTSSARSQLIEPRVIATLGNFATKLITGSQTGITRVRGTPQVHALGGRTVFVLPALPPGGGAAHARRWSRRCARTSPSCPALLAEPLPELGAGRTRAESRPSRGAPRPDPDTTSSTCSVDRRAHASGPRRDRGARRRGSPPGSARRRGPGQRRARQPARRRWSAAPAGRSASSGPVTSPTFTIGRRYRGRACPVSHLDLYRLDGPRRRGAGAARRLPDRRTRSPSSSGPSAAEPPSSRVAPRSPARHAGGDARSPPSAVERRRVEPPSPLSSPGSARRLSSLLRRRRSSSAWSLASSIASSACVLGLVDLLLRCRPGAVLGLLASSGRRRRPARRSAPGRCRSALVDVVVAAAGPRRLPEARSRRTPSDGRPTPRESRSSAVSLRRAVGRP